MSTGSPLAVGSDRWTSITYFTNHYDPNCSHELSTALAVDDGFRGDHGDDVGIYRVPAYAVVASATSIALVPARSGSFHGRRSSHDRRSR